jgi:seryl-tRNA synthetase
MIDPKLLRQSASDVAANLARRGFEFDVETWRFREDARKAAQMETETLRAERNSSAKRIGAAKARGENVDRLLASVTDLGDRLQAAEERMQVAQNRCRASAGLPNLLLGRCAER